MSKAVGGRWSAARVFLAAAGLAGFGFLVYRVGPERILEQLAAVWMFLPLFLGLSILRLVARTRAWAVGLEAEGVASEFRELAGARLISESVGHISAMGVLVSDPLRPLLLRGADASRVAPATFLDTALFWLTTCALGFAGAVAGTILIADSALAAVSLAIFLGSMAAILGILLWPRPLLERFAERWKHPASRWSELLVWASEVERRMRAFRQAHPGALRRMAAWDLVAQALMVAEVWIYGRLTGVAVTPIAAVVVEATSRMVKVAAMAIPGRLGAEEAGAAGVFALLGLGAAAGLGLAILRRLVVVVWAAAGLAWYLLRPAHPGPEVAAVAEETRLS